MTRPSAPRTAQPRTIARRLALVAVGLLLASAAVPTASALAAHQEQVRGQVAKILTAEIDGKTHGVILAVERSTNEEPYAELRVIRGPDPAEWVLIPLKGAPGAIATGDVDGDGNDDVAIAHNLEGGNCPTSAGFELPCGVIRVYDGRGLAEGRLDVLATLPVTPTVEACPPSTYSASTLALGDATGDGRAELAFGQLGAMEGTCGTVRVIPGDRLQGDVAMDDVCAKFQGRPTQANAQPDQFGVHIDLIPGHLAIGAPYATNDKGLPFAGRLDVQDVRTVCRGPSSLLDMPQLVFSKSGTEPGGLLGSDTAYTKDMLWVAAKNLVEGFGLPSFKQERSLDIPRAFPLSVAKDLDGDGRPELLAGPWMVTQEGDVVLHAYPFGAETFRGAVLSNDHILTSDKFGTRLWSLTDVWNPHMTLWSESTSVPPSGEVKVQVAEVVSLLPTKWPIQWQAAGGTLLEEGEGWIRVGAAEPGFVTVQATMKDTVSILRIPVPSSGVSLTGSDTVQVGHPFAVRVNAPEGSTVNWTAPGGLPAEGSGRTVTTQYQTPGERTIAVHVTLPDGTKVTKEHIVDVIEGTLRLTGPTTVNQGDLLRMSIDSPDSTHAYSWILEGTHTGVIRSAGPSLQTLMGGWGTVNVTAVAKTSTGDPVKVGHAQVTVANLPPTINAMEAKASTQSLGIHATGAASDPGGDAVQLAWSIDGVHVAEGPLLNLAVDQEKWVNVTLTATDESGLSSSLTRPLFVDHPWDLVESTEDNATAPNLDNVPKVIVQPADDDKEELPIPGLGILWVILAFLAVVRLRRNE